MNDGDCEVVAITHLSGIALVLWLVSWLALDVERGSRSWFTVGVEKLFVNASSSSVRLFKSQFEASNL